RVGTGIAGSRRGRSPSAGRRDAGCGELGLLGAAAGERCDEAALGGREGAAGEGGDEEVALERRPAGEAGAFEGAARDPLGDGVAREEGDAEPFARGALDGFGRAELPDGGGLDRDRSQLLLEEASRARASLAREQQHVADPFRGEPPGGELERPGPGDADDL